MKTYIERKTGAILERQPKKFYWRGRYFSGLVNTETRALYDDPEDSFAAHVNLRSSLTKGLIFEKLKLKEPEI